MKKSVFLLLNIFFLFGVAAQSPVPGFNCSTIIVGRDASATGFVMVGHNEDDGGDQIVNIYKAAGHDNARGESFRLKDGATELKPSHSYAFLWFEMPGQDFADSYMNENGVIITSNSCPSKENFGEITDGGIGYELRRIVAERALSARTGVELAGQMVEKWGYAASGRSYTIADKNEAWIFAAVRGKQWVAQRIPDDQVAFIPNYYTIQEINLADGENFLASKDLVNYAIRRKWYDPDKDGKFNFTRVYSSERNLTNPGNVMRMWMGVSLLSGKEYKETDNFPFSFVPGKKLTVKDLMTVLANHYEGTKLDDSQGYKKDTPHNNKTHTICASTQQISFIAEMRTGMPWDVGGRIWFAPRRGCINPYMPLYFGITQPPASFTMDTPDKAYEQHFKRGESIYDRKQPVAWWSFVAVAEKADKDYSRIEQQRRKTKEDLNTLFLKRCQQIEKDYLPIYKKQPQKAAALLNDFATEVLNKSIEENNKTLNLK